MGGAFKVVRAVGPEAARLETALAGLAMENRVDGRGTVVVHRSNAERIQFPKMSGVTGNSRNDGLGVQHTVVHAAQGYEFGYARSGGDIQDLLGKSVPAQMGFINHKQEEVAVALGRLGGKQPPLFEMDRVHQTVANGHRGAVIIESEKGIRDHGAEATGFGLSDQIDRRSLGNIQGVAPPAQTDQHHRFAQRRPVTDLETRCVHL